MAQKQLSEFYDRVARLERARDMGLGFEAEGALGRSHYQRPSRRRLRLIGPFLVVAVCFFSVKAMMHYQVGSDLYQSRVENMMAAEGLEKLGGFIMQADPVTLWLSQQMQQYIG